MQRGDSGNLFHAKNAAWVTTVLASRQGSGTIEAEAHRGCRISAKMVEEGAGGGGGGSSLRGKLSVHNLKRCISDQH